MNTKITIHTDASNIKNSNICKLSSIIVIEDNTSTLENFCEGTIAYAELISVIKALEEVVKTHNPTNRCIEVYTDHQPNAKLFNSILLEKSDTSNDSLNKINIILKRKGLTRQDIRVIPLLQRNNNINFIWLPRKENKAADKLSKWK